MSSPKTAGIIDTLMTAENLKTEMRHSWLSDGRQESVAEHSWRLALMVMLLHDRLDQSVDLTKCLQLAVLHDLGEAKAGDVPVFDILTAADKQAKFDAEEQGMIEICAKLGPEKGPEFMALWQEYEACETYEAKFVKALDKVEVHLQHVEAPISTWSDIEFIMWFQPKWMMDYCTFDSTLTSLAEEVAAAACEKMQAAGYNLDELKKEAA